MMNPANLYHPKWNSKMGAVHQKTNLVDLAICCALILLALLGFISYWTTGMLRGDIDGLLLLSICFLVGSIFSALLVLMLRSAGRLKLPTTKRARTAGSLPTLETLQTVPSEAPGGRSKQSRSGNSAIASR
jgi:hypothetical protein